MSICAEARVPPYRAEPGPERRRTLVCLANSRKHGARCVAGLDPFSGQWIRPISRLPDGRVEKHERLVQGREPQLLDILGIPLADWGTDFGFECENRFLLPGEWTIEGRLEPSKLLRFCSRQQHVLHNDGNYVTVEYMRTLPPEQRRTLALVESRDFRVFSSGLSANGGHKWRATFSADGGTPITAIVTDPALVERLEEGHEPDAHCLVTVSLSMPWKPKGWHEESEPCWKLVAGVIELDAPPPGAGERVRATAARRPTSTHRQFADAEVKEALGRVFGFCAFRPHQEDIVRAVLTQQDVFAVMPTGGGKSLCYQLPAKLLSGTCVVVSPLIALMKDQVDAAVANGLRAAFVNSSQTEPEQVAVLRSLYDGKLDLLYVAPERLAQETFFSNLKRAPLSFVAIDEAHCISDWGHDFRPDYLVLAELRDAFPELPIAAFTATATLPVQDNIIGKLHLREPLVVRASFNRPNLFYQVVPKRDAERQILEFVRGRPGETGIVYRMTRRSVDETAEVLREAGLKTLPYHAGMEIDDRTANQEAFSRDEVDVIVATIAFGMGIDKPNIRYVLHGDLPKNIESYYQETGRAGRDGDPAHCLLLFGKEDLRLLRFFVNKTEDDLERQRALANLNAMVAYAETQACRRGQLLNYFGEVYAPAAPHTPPHAGVNCGTCDVCARQRKRRAPRTGRHAAPKRSAGGPSALTGQECSAAGGRDTTGAPLRRPAAPMRASTSIHARTAAAKHATGFTVARIRPANSLYDAALFKELRVLRQRLAIREGVSAYVVFHDRELREMACRFPTRDAELLRITGVGGVKLARYGKAFLDAVSDYLRRTPHAVTVSYERLTSTVETTRRLLERGLSCEDVAVSRGLTVSTIHGHVERLILAGRRIDIDRFIAPAVRERIEETLWQLNTVKLAEVLEALAETVTYNQIRLTRAWLTRPLTDATKPQKRGKHSKWESGPSLPCLTSRPHKSPAGGSAQPRLSP